MNAKAKRLMREFDIKNNVVTLTRQTAKYNVPERGAYVRLKAKHWPIRRLGMFVGIRRNGCPVICWNMDNPVIFYRMCDEFQG